MSLINVCSYESRSRGRPELFAQPLGAQLPLVRTHGLDEVAALPPAELELEAPPLGELEHVRDLGLGDREIAAQPQFI